MKRNLKKRITELFQTHHLLSATDILNKLAQQDHIYNKTSVYRALDQMLAGNLICQLYFRDAQAFYELKHHHHAHLFCSVCQRVFSAACNYNQAEEIDGFQVDHHHLTLIGVCKNCYV